MLANLADQRLRYASGIQSCASMAVSLRDALVKASCSSVTSIPYDSG
jgi:hypothetical protein